MHVCVYMHRRFFGVYVCRCIVVCVHVRTIVYSSVFYAFLSDHACVDAFVLPYSSHMLLRLCLCLRGSAYVVYEGSDVVACVVRSGRLVG